MVSVIQHRNHSQFRLKPTLCAVHFTETKNRPKLRFLLFSVPKPIPKPNFGQSVVLCMCMHVISSVDAVADSVCSGAMYFTLLCEYSTVCICVRVCACFSIEVSRLK